MDKKQEAEKQNSVKYPANGINQVIKQKNGKLVDEKTATEKTEFQQLSFYEKTKNIFSMITVEPVIACYVMPSVLTGLTTQNLYLEKACRVNLNFEDEVCDALIRRDTANYTAQEEAVQTAVAFVAAWKTIVQSLLPCFILIFLGSYSDRVGQRKVLMLLPLIGEFLTCVGMMVNTYFFFELPVEVAAVTESIFPALSGGWYTMFVGVFSYIADVTTEEERTLRVGIVNLFFSLGIPVGSGLSGILLKKIGMYGVYSLSASLYLINFIYTYLRIQEVKKPDPKLKPNNCCEFLKTFFDTRHVNETLKIAFKKGPNQRRLRVIMSVIVFCVVAGPAYGEMAVMYLFTRYRFNWNEVDYSLFSTYSMCTSLVGTFLSMAIFSRLMQMDDTIIGVISSTSKILAAFVYAFSRKSWQIYLAPLVDLFSGTSYISMRSMVSKMVDKEELGTINSVFGVAEAMMPLIYTPMYTGVYMATIKTLPGAFFLVGGGLTIPGVLIYGWLYLTNKKEIRNKAAESDANKPEKSGVVNIAFVSEENNKDGKSFIEAQTILALTENPQLSSKL